MTLTPEQLAELRGVLTAIAEGPTSWNSTVEEWECALCEEVQWTDGMGKHESQPNECPVLTARKLLALVEGMGE